MQAASVTKLYYFSKLAVLRWMWLAPLNHFQRGPFARKGAATSAAKKRGDSELHSSRRRKGRTEGRRGRDDAKDISQKLTFGAPSDSRIGSHPAFNSSMDFFPKKAETEEGG